MKSRTLSKTRLATLIGISKQLLGHHARGALRKAVTEHGVDIDHPSAVAYLAKYNVTPDQLIARDAGVPATQAGRPARAPTRVLALPASVPSDQPSHRAFNVPLNADELQDMTFRQIAARYGSLEGFETWVDLRKKTAETRRIELQNQETDGRLIERELVRTHIFGAIDASNRRLLSDSPTTLALRVTGAVKSNQSMEDIKQLIRDHIGAQLAIVKTTAARILREQRQEQSHV